VLPLAGLAARERRVTPPNPPAAPAGGGDRGPCRSHQCARAAERRSERSCVDEDVQDAWRPRGRGRPPPADGCPSRLRMVIEDAGASPRERIPMLAPPPALATEAALVLLGYLRNERHGRGVDAPRSRCGSAVISVDLARRQPLSGAHGKLRNLEACQGRNPQTRPSVAKDCGTSCAVSTSATRDESRWRIGRS
jgi:hypothetical protein